MWPELLHSQGRGHAWQQRQRRRAKVTLAYLCALADWLAAVWFLLLAILGLSGEREVAGGSGSTAAKRRHVARPRQPLQASMNTAAPRQLRTDGRQQLDVRHLPSAGQNGDTSMLGPATHACLEQPAQVELHPRQASRPQTSFQMANRAAIFQGRRAATTRWRAPHGVSAASLLRPDATPKPPTATPIFQFGAAQCHAGAQAIQPQFAAESAGDGARRREELARQKAAQQLRGSNLA